MKWYELSLVTDFASSDMLQMMLVEEGAGGVEIDDPALLHALEGRWVEADEPLPTIVLPPDRRVAVKAYFHEDPTLEGLFKGIESRVGELVASRLIPETETHVREVSEEDWATSWKQYFNPLAIGRKILIIPSWKVDEPLGDIAGGVGNRVGIILDPGMAFGTGNHPTTSLCLEILEDQAAPGMDFVDVGTGSGILAIAASKLGAAGKAIDIDSLAVGVARDNMAVNGVSDSVECHCGDITDPGFREEIGLSQGGADLVIANIVPEVIIRLLPAMSGLLKAGGRMILSGIIEGKFDSIAGILTEYGLEASDVRDSGEWRAILAVKA